jgi:uncharacterized lipoprotein YajG
VAIWPSRRGVAMLVYVAFRRIMAMSRLAWLAPIVVLLAGCAQPGGTVAAGPNTPGWTGRTVVPGSGSTVAGNAEATDLQQKWGVGRER